jgi:hypothetical protein
VSAADIATICAILTAASIVVQWMFRTPKEEIAKLRADVDRLERDAREYAGTHGRHEESLRNLTLAVERLTNRIDTLMGNGHGRKP